MAIKIQDNFQLNVALPIDNRIVASGSTARNNIAFKYDGLRVFDTFDRKSYVWNSSSLSWSDSDTAGTGLTTTLAKWGTTTGLTSSGVYFVSGSGLNLGKVGINTNDPKGPLHIVGDGGVAKFVFHSYGGGVVFGQNFWNNGSDQYFDYGYGSSVIRMTTSGQIDFLARVFNTIPLNSTGEAGNTNLLMRLDPSTSPARTTFYSDMLFSTQRVIPTGSNSALYLRAANGFSTAGTPDITWWYNSDTGIFHPAFHQIGFSIQGVQMMRLTSTGLIVGNQTQTSNRILINNSGSVGTYLQATNATMGSGSTRGAFFGINTQGSATILSREGSGLSTKPISLGFNSGNISHKFDDTTFSIYGGGVTEAESITQEKSRCIRGFAQASGNYTGGLAGLPVFIGSFYIPPSSALCSIEATFTTRLNTHYRVQKLLWLVHLDASGNFIFQSTTGGILNTFAPVPANEGGVQINQTPNLDYPQGLTIYTLGSSQFSTNIGNGMIDPKTETNPRSFEFAMKLKANGTWSSSVSYVVNVIDF